MHNLKLKKEYSNHNVTMKHPKLGDLTFNKGTDSEQYPYFYENGFSFLFDVVPNKKIEAVLKGKTTNKKYTGIINEKAPDNPSNPTGEMGSVEDESAFE